MSIAAVGLLIIVGIAAGTIAGFFGVGGGVIIVPMLVYAFGYSQKMAGGTSLVSLLGPVGIMGVIAYYKSGNINADNIKAGAVIAVGMIAGTYLGSKIALSLPSETLRKSFALFLMLVAIRLWFQTAGKG